MIKKGVNTYIINLEGAYIYKEMISESKNYSTKNIDESKLYTATVPYNLETIRLDKEYGNEIITVDGKQYTKSLININFSKNYIKWIDDKDKEGKKIRKKEKASKKKIRRYIYKNGFILDGIKYIFYKRGASKARTGNALFIKEYMYNKLMRRSRLIHNNFKDSNKGLVFEEGEECDITSLNAYQSLILSGLEDTITIDPKSILLIDDIKSKPFKTRASVTKQVNKELVTKTEIIERINNMTDGQGLLDESVFKLANRESKGMMLLRNDFFKCCSFNTKIQKFFKDQGITEVTDMFGRTLKAEDIKLITTPSSIKYLKFSYKFDSKEECYDNWLKNIDSTFGIVKSDGMGNYGTWNRTTYQILNSMPFTKKDIRELIEPELVYIHNLKNNLAYFKNHIAIKNDEVELLENDIGELVKSEEKGIEFISENDTYKTSELVNNLLAINSDFQYTTIFKTWKRDQITSYINELRKGKIRLKDTFYCTIVANPYEMLLSSIGRYTGDTLAKDKEVYCKYYNDGQELATFRNPHINCGNAMVTINKWHEEYRYFNLTDNILIVNVSDNDLPDRGQGLDFDSDTLLLIPNKTVVEVAKRCLIYPTPINLVKGDSKKRFNTNKELAKLDYVLSNNFIGKIINKSQIINSYMWNCKHNGADEGLVNKLYDISSMLSSLSQIELDKAKKSFDNISMAKELQKINNIEYNGEKLINILEELDEKGNKIKKMIVPNFFGYVAADNTYRDLTKFETSMDYLQEILDLEKKSNRTYRKNIKDLLVKAKELEGVRNLTEQHENIFKIISKCGKKINSCNMPTCPLNSNGRATVIINSKKEAIQELSKLKINSKTILSILNKCFSKDKTQWSRYGMLTLNLLYNSHTLETLTVFKSNDNNDTETLVIDKYGDINIFGVRYKVQNSKN
ncbi:MULTISPECIES: hypothetical protein [unclassified Clostridium]|uniref:hypothetical protein n=1 Tax=unclassified Clostridium TaxID=2614128 RepID=UPI0025BAF4F5|nr:MULTISPECIES: hypothetical protein [unclassified Clostridium]